MYNHIYIYIYMYIHIYIYIYMHLVEMKDEAMESVLKQSPHKDAANEDKNSRERRQPELCSQSMSVLLHGCVLRMCVCVCV
jgi:hypothetical protein